MLVILLQNADSHGEDFARNWMKIILHIIIKYFFSKRFSAQGNLHAHLKIHTGQRDHVSIYTIFKCDSDY